MTDKSDGKPAKYQYQKSIPEGQMDAIYSRQTDTGHAIVKRPVMVLGDGGEDNEGPRILDIAQFQHQTLILQSILCELQKLNEQINILTEYES